MSFDLKVFTSNSSDLRNKNINYNYYGYITYYPNNNDDWFEVMNTLDQITNRDGKNVVKYYKHNEIANEYLSMFSAYIWHRAAFDTKVKDSHLKQEITSLIDQDNNMFIIFEVI